jgi:hypothetical protein
VAPGYLVAKLEKGLTMSVIDRIHSDQILKLEKKVEMLSYEIANLKIKVASLLEDDLDKRDKDGVADS